MFFSSFDLNVVFEIIWQISGNCLLKITRHIYWLNYSTMNEAPHTMSLKSPSKSSSSFNMSNNDPTSFISNERETLFGSGMEWKKIVWTCCNPFDTKKFSKPEPGNLVEWIAP